MSDDALARLRAEIAERDVRILETVNERLRLVAELKAHKQREGMAFVDAAQEERVLERLVAANTGPLSDEAVRTLFTEILALTKRELD